MYEDMTYEYLMGAMLDRVKNDVDKREGSIIYDALGPTAYYLAEMYFLLAHYPDLVLPDTSADAYLERFAEAFGIVRKQAVKAVRKVTASAEIETGSRWQLHDSSYLITNRLAEFEYEAECEQYGSIGNHYYGVLESINNGGKVTAALEDVLITGAEAESDDALRTRLLARMQKPSASGNIYDYYNWAMSVNGVGAARVFPLADGPGTVKVVITGADKAAADEALVRETADYIETVRPIGADVTVVSAVEKTININVKVKLQDGVYLSDARDAFEKSVEEFLKDKIFAVNYISLARIGNLLLGVDGVEDYAELTVNGEENNIAVADEEVAVAGAVRLEVML